MKSIARTNANQDQNGSQMSPRVREEAPCVAFGAFRMLVRERQLLENGRPVRLGGRAFDILVALLEQPGVVIDKRDLVNRAWPGINVEESSLRFHVASLRRALRDGEDGARLIANVPGRGYCFVGFVADQSAARCDTAACEAPLTDFPGDDALANVLMSARFIELLRIAVSEAVRETVNSDVHRST